MNEETRKWIERYYELSSVDKIRYYYAPHGMPYEEGETVATLCEWLCQPDGEYVEYARIKLRLAFVTLPYGEQRMTALTMINGPEEDFKWVCCVLCSNFCEADDVLKDGLLWLDEYSDAILRRLEEVPYNNAARILVLRASDDMLLDNLDLLMHFPYCYHELCKRLYDNPRFTIDMQYLKETTAICDFFEFKQKHNIPISYAEAREALYYAIVMYGFVDMGYGPSGWSQEEPYHRSRLSVFDGEPVMRLFRVLSAAVGEALSNEFNAWQTVTNRFFLEYYCISNFDDIQEKDLNDAVVVYKTCMFVNIPKEFRCMLCPNTKDYMFYCDFADVCTVPRYHSACTPYTGCLSTRNDNLPPAFLPEKLERLNNAIAAAKTGDEVFDAFYCYDIDPHLCDYVYYDLGDECFPAFPDDEYDCDDDPFYMSDIADLFD